MVGPVLKIDERALPRAANITYPGPKQYDELPGVMAEFDVALMPFALNEATRSISPTKTLEYLAAGLPVVSTHVPDVVTDFGKVVRLADRADFAEACRSALDDRDAPAATAQGVLDAHRWSSIAHRMAAAMDAAESRLGAVSVEQS